MENNKHKLIKPFKSGLVNVGELFSTMPNDFEVVRKDFFSLEFPASFGISTRFIVRAARPKVSNASKEVPFKNLVTFYKGKTKCEPITIEFRDCIGPSVYRQLQLWQNMHTDFLTGAGGYAATYKQTLNLYVEDPLGAVIQKFILEGCFMTELDGGELDMTSDDIADVKFTIQYDSYRMEF